MNNAPTSQAEPRNTAWFTQLFAAYSEWLLKRNFHSVRLLGEPNLHQYDGRPLVVFANHPSWWDPIVGMVVWRRLMRSRVSHAPIDAGMLEKYAFFKRLGYFGVDKHSIGGVRTFLKTGQALLARPDTLMFITPQGRFSDVRENQPIFESGLSHLATRARNAVYLPMAFEFTYWEEKRPEVLIRFGEPTYPTSKDSAQALNKQMETKLAAAIARLSTASIHRETEAFQNLLAGNDGTHFVYDNWRRLKAALRGRSFQAAHGTK